MQKFSIANLQQAAAEIRDFNPVLLELTQGVKVKVGKIPGAKFDEALARWTAQVLPLIDDPTSLDMGTLIRAISQDIPEVIAFFIEHGTDLPKEKIGELLFDERILLLMGVATVSFVDAAGVRCFFAGSPEVGQAVLDELPTAATTAPNEKEN